MRERRQKMFKRKKGGLFLEKEQIISFNDDKKIIEMQKLSKLGFFFNPFWR